MTTWTRDHTLRLVSNNSNPLENSETKIDLSFKMEDQPEKSLRELFSPITINPPSCIVLPATSTKHFELKPQIIQLLPNYHGLNREDPYMHVNDFLEICATFRFTDFSDESVRLRLFPFSLKDKAKAWLNSLPADSVTTWDMLVSKFLSNSSQCLKLMN